MAIIFIVIRYICRDARVFDPQKYEVKDRLTYCNSLVKLNRRQMAFCIKNPRIVKVFEHGFKMGIQACVDKFRNNSYTRWNCTNTTKKKKTNVFFGVAMAVGKCIVFVYRIQVFPVFR